MVSNQDWQKCTLCNASYLWPFSGTLRYIVRSELRWEEPYIMLEAQFFSFSFVKQSMKHIIIEQRSRSRSTFVSWPCHLKSYQIFPHFPITVSSKKEKKIAKMLEYYKWPKNSMKTPIFDFFGENLWQLLNWPSQLTMTSQMLI